MIVRRPGCRAPEQPLLTRLTQDQLAELIERHIDYTDETGCSVHLAAPFVRHYLDRTDDALPVVAAIATLPVVLPDGTILAGHGLVRERGVVFRMPERLMALLPTVEECHDEAVLEALTFLTRHLALRCCHRLHRQMHSDRRRAHPDRAVAVAGPSGILRHGGTPRWRQDHHTGHAADGGDWRAAQCRSLVAQRGRTTQRRCSRI